SGRPMQDVEVQITSPAGVALEAGQTGEIWVRGFNVMQGYLDDLEATQEAITPDGWLKTGDIGTQDEQGYLSITDRVKDMYICGGFNCYPAEIENSLLSHPDITDVAVLGAVDERLGEVGYAFIVARDGATPDEAEIIAWSRLQMANFKAPRYISFVTVLPRNASGKVQKYLLKQQMEKP
ncbi:MAG: AMP-binding protein, partial [Gammaproteobacteria bacterium]|nr:AMP-binding protein [Gammaproteobacteria bacterium]